MERGGHVSHTFGMVGGGFRSRIFLDIARALPEAFSVAGVVVRRREQAKTLEREMGVGTFATIEDLLATCRPDFMILAIPPTASFDYVIQCHDQRIPTLVETPAASDLAGLVALYRLATQGARIQVAEQYRFRPMMMARQQVVDSGRIGAVTGCDVSISHGYHGIHLMRTFLHVGFEPVSIRAMRFSAPMMNGPDRHGPPLEERLISVARELAWFDFGDKLGVFDFTQNQHRSWIRKPHLAIWGTHGEIQEDRVRYLIDAQTPMELPFLRVERGREENVEAYGLRGITLGETWVYQNPFPQHPFSDEEIAVATMLTKMAAYAKGGPDFYDVRQAAQDQYLALLMHESMAGDGVISSTFQPWMAPSVTD